MGSSELANISLQSGRGLQLQTIEDLQRAAKLFISSGLFGNDKVSNEVGIARTCIQMMAGNEMGLSPFFAMKNIFIIPGGGVAYSYQLIALLIKRSGKYKFKVLERTKQKCVLEFFEKENNEWVSIDKVEYGEAQAKQEELFHKGNYKKMPDVMFFSRCLTRGANMYFTDIFGGSVYSTADFGLSEDEAGGTSSTSNVANAGAPVNVTVDPLPEPKAVKPDVPLTPQPGVEQMGQLLESGLGNGWTEEQLEEFIPGFLKGRGVDAEDEDKLLATWQWRDFEAAIKYVTENQPEVAV